MKKVFLTGNTKGLGKAIQEELSRVVGEYEITGASRTKGSDINKINYLWYSSYDILINNAYHSTAQMQILKDFYHMWQGKDKIIINIGTAGLNVSGRPYETLNYNAAKKQLETYSRWISENDEHCKCMLFSPGYMETELVKSRAQYWDDETKAKNTSKSLDMSYCAKLIRLMIESPHTIRDLQLLP